MYNSTDFQSNFDINPDIPHNQKAHLYQCLNEHKDSFITPDNPSLVRDETHLTPDAKSKHQPLSKINHWSRWFEVAELKNMFGILSSQG